MKKILLSLFILFIPVCLWSGGVLFMAGGVESGVTPTYDLLVDPDGTGDYTTLSAAIASISGSLPSTPYIIECISSSGTADTTAVTIGTITGASAVGDFIVRGGTGNKASTTFSDSKYRLRGTSGTVLTISTAYLTITNLQVELQDTGAYGTAVQAGLAGSVSTLLLDGLYINGNNARGSLTQIDGATGSTIDIRNSIIAHLSSGSSSGLMAIQTNVPTVNLYNNTFANCSQAFSLQTSAGGGSTRTVENCVFSTVPQSTVDCTYDYNGFDTSETRGTNATEVSDWTAEFTNEVSDYSLLIGATIRAAGTDLSSIFTNDIDQNTRSAWDLGASEYQ